MPQSDPGRNPGRAIQAGSLAFPGRKAKDPAGMGSTLMLIGFSLINWSSYSSDYCFLFAPQKESTLRIWSHQPPCWICSEVCQMMWDCPFLSTTVLGAYETVFCFPLPIWSFPACGCGSTTSVRIPVEHLRVCSSFLCLHIRNSLLKWEWWLHHPYTFTELMSPNVYERGHTIQFTNLFQRCC